MLATATAAVVKCRFYIVEEQNISEQRNSHRNNQEASLRIERTNIRKFIFVGEDHNKCRQKKKQIIIRTHDWQLNELKSALPLHIFKESQNHSNNSEASL